MFLPAEIGAFFPPAVQLALAAIGAALTLLVARVVWRWVREDEGIRFLALGAALSFAPILASSPADRLLIFCGVGAFAIVATSIVRGADEAATRATRILRRVFIGFHLVLAPLLLPLVTIVPGALERLGERGVAGFVRPAADRIAVILNLPNPFAGMPLIFDPRFPAPQRVRVLGTSGNARRR